MSKKDIEFYSLHHELNVETTTLNYMVSPQKKKSKQNHCNFLRFA